MTKLYKQISVIENGKRVHKKIELSQDEINALNAVEENSSHKESVARIKERLKQIDAEASRPLRAKVVGMETQEDIDKLVALEEESQQLRVDLAELK